MLGGERVIGVVTVDSELTVKRETQRRIPKTVTRNAPL